MTDFYPAQDFDKQAFKDSVLIVPSVSLANLPQLTADLLITSLGLFRVGFIGRGETVVPFAGAGEVEGEIVTGGLEVYGRKASDIFVVQQRSPTLKTKKDAHTALLTQFITSHNFAFVLILTSLDAANQDDAQLLTPHQHITTPSSSTSPALHLKRLTSTLPQLNLNLTASGSSSTPYPPFLPSAGLTRRLLSSLQSSPTPHGAIAAWCVEGDNRGDARALASVVLDVLDVRDVELTQPKSWTGLFGVTEGWSGGMGRDSELYG